MHTSSHQQWTVQHVAAMRWRDGQQHERLTSHVHERRVVAGAAAAGTVACEVEAAGGHRRAGAHRRVGAARRHVHGRAGHGAVAVRADGKAQQLDVRAIEFDGGQGAVAAAEAGEGSCGMEAPLRGDRPDFCCTGDVGTDGALGTPWLGAATMCAAGQGSGVKDQVSCCMKAVQPWGRAGAKSSPTPVSMKITSRRRLP